MAYKLLLAGLLLTVSRPVIAGMISLTSTPYPDSVVIEVTVDDTGGSPQCPYLVLLRNGGPTFLFVERQIGTTITKHLVDTNVNPNTLYCYTMDFGFNPFQPGCGSLCDAFECFYLIQTCVNTGPDPAFIAHGLLSYQYPDGTPVDGNETNALLYSCNQPSYYWWGLYSITPEVAQYVDTGIGVDLYGTWQCCWAQGMWLLIGQVAVPHDCPLPAQETTWGRVKAMYRD